MNETIDYSDLIQRWRRAGERALEENVRILDIGGEYYATSSSQPLGSYRLQQSAEGWRCECMANGEYRLPCKHLSALADVLGLDVLRDIRVEWPPAAQASRAA